MLEEPADELAWPDARALSPEPPPLPRGVERPTDAGDVDAFCVDKSILANYKTDGRSFIADSFSPQEYGVATKKGSELSGEVEALITEWLADGTIDGMIKEWGLE